MENKTFEVVFRGKIVKGEKPQEVKSKLALLFKCPVAAIDKLFVGGRVVIKKKLTHDIAHKYRKAIKHAGAITVVVDAGFKQVVPPPSSQIQAVTEVSNLRPTKQDFPPQHDIMGYDTLLADAGAIITVQVKIPEPSIDISGLSLAELGALIDEPVKTTTLDLNIDQFTLDSPGSIIDKVIKVDAPKINISNLGLSELGSEFDKKVEIKVADIDISEIDFASDDGPIDKTKPVSPLIIDTSQIKLKDN